MSRAAIKISALGKRYRRGKASPATGNLREDLTRWAKGLVRLGNRVDDEDRSFWALKDVSFEVARGDIVGLIGRNGAGKSTLLKILSRITPPTSGRAEYRGRLASLLEVGTGFHRELTGRENVFLNGSILGMKRAEIANKLDAIVEFAEIGPFLDTAVKFYSSGMYVRLAFAVAAHLDPDILLVDEVLAVGDAAFQKKCLGTIGNVAQAGRTVVFVSHNLASLASVCSTGVVLESGEVTFRGTIRDAIDRYLVTAGRLQGVVSYEPKEGSEIQFRSVSVGNEGGESLELLSGGSPIRIAIEYDVPDPLSRAQIVCHVWSVQRVHVFATADIDDRPELLEGRERGRYRAEITVPALLLAPGVYQVSVACGVPNLRLIDERQGPTFEVSAVGTQAATWSGARQDVVVGLPMSWHVSRVEQ
jgi:lipopolysaccharide transport system ATP-binding protein